MKDDHILTMSLQKMTAPWKPNGVDADKICPHLIHIWIVNLSFEWIKMNKKIMLLNRIINDQKKYLKFNDTNSLRYLTPMHIQEKVKN